MPAAADRIGGKTFIIVNKRIFSEVLGKPLDFADTASITGEIKAALSHEMAHIKNNDFVIGRIAKYTPWAMMVGSVIGLLMIRNHQEKNKGNPSASLTPQEAEKSMDIEQCSSPTMHTAKKVALYTVTAAAGLTAGTFVSRGLLHRAEFAADAFTKNEMGLGKELVSLFAKVNEYKTGLEDKVFKNMPEALAKPLKLATGVFEGIFHPSISSRIERVR